MKNTKYKNSALLFLAALIWGVAFVAQSVGMDYVEPFTFNGVRSVLGGIVLIPCIFILDALKKKDGAEPGKWDKNVIVGGIICGIFLFAASTLQQFGIKYTTVGKAGFITAFYIVLVPVIGLFFKKKSPWTIWISIVLAVCGLYLLCITEEFTIGTGDLLVFLCALMFSGHILFIDHFAPKVDGVRMSCIQFFVCGILSLIGMAFFEAPSFKMITAAWLPICYAGIMSCGVAYTLQIIGQKGLNPAVASLILSLESVVSVLAGWVILKQSLSVKELIGCALMFVAIILVECAPVRKKDKTEQR